MSSMKTIAIIQARTGSSRLPGKVLMDICGETMLEREVARVGIATTVDDVVVATTTSTRDDSLADLCVVRDWLLYRGSEDDVLDRFYQAALHYEADTIVRITADCPLIDPQVIDAVVSAFLARYPNVDYAANIINNRTYPRGLDTEVISIVALRKEWLTIKKWREHVTLNLRKNLGNYRTVEVASSLPESSYMRWCVDTADDLEFMRRVYQHFTGRDFGWLDIVDMLENEHPEWVIEDKQEDP